MPQPTAAEVNGAQPDAMLEELLDLFNHQQQVNQAGTLVARYLASGAAPERLIATLGQALLREDAGFHPIQSLEAAVRQYWLLAARPTRPRTRRMPWWPRRATWRTDARAANSPALANQTYYEKMSLPTVVGVVPVREYATLCQHLCDGTGEFPYRPRFQEKGINT